MSPLPSPEERRKRLTSPVLEDVFRRRARPTPNEGRRKSAAELERENQRTEARRRGKQPVRP